MNLQYERLNLNDDKDEIFIGTDSFDANGILCANFVTLEGNVKVDVIDDQPRIHSKFFAQKILV